MSYVDHLRAALAESDWILLQRLAEIAAQAGMSLYIVGGPVRDCLLRRVVTDLDLTTEGDAHTLARTLARELGGAWKKFDRFGTAKLVLPGRDGPIDLATTRTEMYAYPGALPAVTRGTIETDLFRRDFTINAMAIRLDGEQQGTLIDRHGGESDLYSGVLRVLHNRSFADDPTRLLRGVRFEQRFNFAFAGDTAPLGALGGRRAGDVVGSQNRPGGNRVELRQLARHVEVHAVAAVIAVEAQYAGTAVCLSDRLAATGNGRTFEDIADRAGVEQALAHITGEQRQVARAAAGDDADLAGLDAARPRDDPLGLTGPHETRMGHAQALEHLIDIHFRLVDDLLHGSPRRTSTRRTQPAGSSKRRILEHQQRGEILVDLYLLLIGDLLHRRPRIEHR